MDSQHDFYKHTHTGSEPQTSEINGNLFYVHAFLIRLSAVHLIQDMKQFTRLIYVHFFPKCTCFAVYNAIKQNVFIIARLICSRFSKSFCKGNINSSDTLHT